MQRLLSKQFFLFMVCAGFISCSGKKTLFQVLPSSQTGIKFINTVEENDKYNVLDYMNIYTGAGVAAGDINNDGLTDLFFSGNQTTCRLYINKGNMKFEDVTEKAGLITNRWCTGVSMVDINQDGFLDIYINVAGSTKFGSTANLLFINKGISPSPPGEGRGEVTFTEEAEKYGIADTRLTMNASFFDYDKDDDLDLFLITNPADERVNDVNTIKEIQQHGESAGVDILYRNNGNGTFTDVSKAAGILKDGYSLGAAISDVNNDGWPDIYVSNDFLTSDILYINNGLTPSPSGEGQGEVTFTDRTHECLKHSSFASMGNDVADFNNDGLPDIYVLDMLPEDNYRKKMIIPSASYDKYQLLQQNGYEIQYTRNTLQLNNGLSPSLKGEGRGEVTFSDIAFLAGVSATDWSWSSLFADYDNDGDKDLMVTNGFYRDLGDLDYITYQAKLQNPMGSQDIKREQKLKAVKDLAKIPLKDYLFENNSNLTFTKRTDEWGFSQPGFSNGACYADLDNDGDLELIINQFNSEAKVYKNNSREFYQKNYLQIKLQGEEPNRQAIGAKVWVYTKDTMQFQELNPYRGYESTMETTLHFGLNKNEIADSIKIIWPNGRVQIQMGVKANQTLAVSFSHMQAPAETKVSSASPSFDGEGWAGLFTDVGHELSLNYYHKENEFVDFKVQPLLPHMHSKEGPGIAVGDINGDNKEDFYIGGAAGYSGSFFIQQPNMKFIEKPLQQGIAAEDMGVLLFDADNDNDLDLYVVSGGSENNEGSADQQDRLYLNDGKGNFTYSPAALPDTKASGSCVTACDYDKDGDLDLFVGGRVVPGSYPMPAKSYLLKNDGGKFTDISNQLPQGGKTGMVTAALWTDYDNDGWVDLLLAGEFMPVTFLKNTNGQFRNLKSEIQNSSGWWNSITAGDFDEDGDIDYIAGNLGLNTRHKANSAEPLCIYAKDYDKNGRLDPIMCYYVQGKNYIYHTRDEMIKQINPIRSRFQSYKDFATHTFEESFAKDDLKDAFIVKAECFESSYFENKGKGIFERKTLPLQCQFAPLYGMLTGDYDGDGHLDVLLTGNSYATEASTGRYDAMSGLFLKGDGKGNFKILNSNATGFNADGDSKGIAQLTLPDNSNLILVGNNAAPMKSFRLLAKYSNIISLSQNDKYVLVYKSDGSMYKQEVYFGNSYLSNSSGKITLGKNIKSVTIVDNKMNKRQINFIK
jgi:enediyne biosynthesis protein E4